MPLTKRDKAIIADLNRFRVMDRDSVSEIHFKGLKRPTFAANNVLLRLLREGHIQRSTAFSPYVYFGPEVSMKKNSAKIGHFLAILNVYKEVLQNGKLDTFLVEPKFVPKSEGAEPDIFCIFRKTPFFIEVQRTLYSEKQMNEKFERYVELYHSGVMENEPWQTENKVFPRVLIVTQQRYAIDNKYPFKVIQAESFTQFLQSLKPKEERRLPSEIKSSTLKRKTI